MARLKSTWELKEEINSIDISKDLRKEVNKFIVNNEVIGIPHSFSNIVYRSNLHYIIDKISDPNLIIELRRIQNV